MNEEEDSFLEQLMSDDKALDNWIQRLSETPTESSFSENEHHVVYVKKRNYEWRNATTRQRSKAHKHIRQGTCCVVIPIPRILKSDIRRKLVSMYENVMNSYNYHLISSYFQRFFVANSRLEKKDSFNSPVKTILEGVQPMLSFFLLLLQMSPDKITRVSDIQLKQSSNNIERTEIAFQFITKSAKLYQTNPYHVVDTLQNDLTSICESDDTFIGDPLEELPSMKQKKRKFEDKYEEERHKSLFDPVSGIFLQERFSRFERPVQYEVEGYMSFIVNSEKRIERLIITPKH